MPKQTATSRTPKLAAKPTKMNKRAEQLLAKLKSTFANYTPPPTPPREFFDAKPGLYLDIPFEAYAALDALNFSSLKGLDHSPAKYKHAPPLQDDSGALRVGNLIHTAVLEPEELLQRYIVMPDLTKQVGKDPKTGKPYKNPKATKRYRELVEAFSAQHPDKIIATQEDFNLTEGICRSIRNQPWSKENLTPQEIQTEVTLIWHDKELDLLCKARIDAINITQGIMFDLKTTMDVTDFDIGKFNYHQQAAFYQWGFAEVTDVWLTPYIGAVEKQPPYSSRIAPIHDDALALAAEELTHKLTDIATCRRLRRYPGPKSPAAWSLPKWYRPYTPYHHNGHPQ